MEGKLEVRVDVLPSLGVMEAAPMYDGGNGRDAVVAGIGDNQVPELVSPAVRYAVPMAELTAERLRVIADAMELSREMGRETGVIVVSHKGWHGSEVGYLSV